VCPGSGASGASAGARRSRHLPAVVPGPRPAAGMPCSSRIGGLVWCEGRRNCFYSARMTMLWTAIGNGVGPPRRASRRSHHPTAHARPELSTADSATQPLLHINRLPAAYPAISKHLHLPNNSCHFLHLEIDGTSFVSLLCIIILHYHISVMPDDCQQPLAFILHPIVSTRVLLVKPHCRHETKLSEMCCSSDVLQHLAQV
jgi:hypothetical protein